MNTSVLCLRKVPVAKNPLDKKGRVSRFSVESFFVSECQNFSQGNTSVLCLRKFAVAIKIMDKRAGGIKIFLETSFCFRVPEHFVEENFCAVFQNVSASEKDYG